VGAEGVLVGSGSDEIIELIAKTFLDLEDEIVVAEHAFVRYKMAGRLMNIRVVEVPMVDGFRHDARAMAKAVGPRTKIVFIANPNNPTGTYVTTDEFRELLSIVPPRVLIVVDEAYYEFSRLFPDYPDSVAIAKEGHPGIVTLRTFSKAYGLAGLRVGYALADRTVISQIDRIRPPFNVTIPSQAACEAALEDTEHVDATVAVNSDNMEWLRRRLDSCKIPYVPSVANFLLVKTRLGSQKVFEALLQKGVIVRPMTEYGFPDHIRVSIGNLDEMEFFLEHFLPIDSGTPY
jgi:histidinol-phosphate aminotransferase